MRRRIGLRSSPARLRASRPSASRPVFRARLFTQVRAVHLIRLAVARPTTRAGEPLRFVGREPALSLPKGRRVAPGEGPCQKQVNAPLGKNSFVFAVAQVGLDEQNSTQFNCPALKGCGLNRSTGLRFFSFLHQRTGPEVGAFATHSSDSRRPDQKRNWHGGRRYGRKYASALNSVRG